VLAQLNLKTVVSADINKIRKYYTLSVKEVKRLRLYIEENILIE